MNRLASILPVSNVMVDVEATSKKRAFEQAGVLFENQHSIALPDGSISSAFLEMFGRPPRDTGLESERNNRPTAEQRLLMMWPLTLDAWALAGLQLPTYARHETPISFRVHGANDRADRRP